MSKNEIRIVDLDGTISNDTWRRWMIHLEEKDGESKYHNYHIHCNKDEVINRHIVDESPVPVFFMTARPEYVRNKTVEWLRDNNFNYQALIMRPNDNHEHSVDLKLNLTTKLLQFFTVERAYDDRPDVINMFNSIGIKGILA